MDNIINCNMDGFQCVVLKLVSGEEIVAHVDEEEYNNVDDELLILHNPYKVVVHDSMINLTKWILSNVEDVFIIAKCDVMIRTIPSKRFEEVYMDVICDLYSSSAKDSPKDEYNYDNVVFLGNDTIN